MPLTTALLCFLSGRSVCAVLPFKPESSNPPPLSHFDIYEGIAQDSSCITGNVLCADGRQADAVGTAAVPSQPDERQPLGCMQQSRCRIAIQTQWQMR